MTLYRKYRPTRFADLIGQPTVSRTLQQALEQKRSAHAYLFSGPRGTGKTTTARIFARALTCLNPLIKKTKEGVQFEPCNECEACVGILAGQCPDVIEIDAASNRGIEDIRSLREQVQYGPIQLSRKVYIIDEVHMLTGEAFNALLKTLEEPPAHAVFILATTELHKVPATIRSRCQLIRFERASLAGISTKLRYIADAEGWKIEEGALTIIAQHADGAFRDAETLLEHLATQHSPLTTAAAIDALGTVEEAVLDELLEAVLTTSSPAILAVLEQHFRLSSLRVEQVLTRLIEKTRERLYASKGKNSAVLVQFLEALLESYILLRSAPDPLLVLELACLCVASPSGEKELPIQQPELKKPISVPPQKSTSTPVVSLKPQPVDPPQAVPVVELRDAPMPDIRRAWKEAVSEIARTNLPLGQMLRDTLLHTAEDGMVTIHVRYKFHVEKLSEKKNSQQVELLLEKLTGQAWRINYLLSESVPRRKPAKELEAGGGTSAHDIAAIFGSN